MLTNGPAPLDAPEEAAQIAASNPKAQAAQGDLKLGAWRCFREPLPTIKKMTLETRPPAFLAAAFVVFGSKMSASGGCDHFLREWVGASEGRRDAKGLFEERERR